MKVNPILLEVFKNRFAAISEEMGVTLTRTAFSPNIKERRDLSCAVFDAQGDMIAQAAHIPVHLGSMPLSVKSAIESVRFRPGDMVMLNDPYKGGSHLPDITLVAPVFAEGTETGDGEVGKGRAGKGGAGKGGAGVGDANAGSVGEKAGGERRAKEGRAHGDEPFEAAPVFYVANRAHHADVGGMASGSMPLSTCLYQEGIIIPPTRVVERGEMVRPVMDLILNNVRTPVEREGDFAAQVMANVTGVRRLTELVGKYGLETVDFYAKSLVDYAETFCRRTVSELPDGEYSFTDLMDGDGLEDFDVPIAVTLNVRGDEAVLDFSDSGDQVGGSVNAVRSITLSAVLYVFRSLIEGDVPTNAGILRPLTVITRKGSILDANFPAAVAGGNVETSQRVVDVVLGALARAVPERIPAASQGTMNNMTIGGTDARTGQPFAYYETLAGGMGASASGPGEHAVHSHMTNTLNTPVEALEFSYPFRVNTYAVRRGTGGQGKHPGGDGLVREIELLSDCEITVLSERRVNAPYGLQGGQPGTPGLNALIRGGKTLAQPGKFHTPLKQGDVVRIETPGGGGWGESGGYNFL